MPTSPESGDATALDEIVKMASTRLGVSESVAREAVKVLLQLVMKRAAGTKLEKRLTEIPGVSSLLGTTFAEGRTFGGTSFGAGSIGEAAKAFFALRAAGLKSAQIAPFLQTVLNKAREVVGPETIEEILDRLPALRALIKT